MVEEYPFSGIINRTVVNKDDNTGETSEQKVVIYDGKMDYSMNTAEIGNVAQTSNYVVFMPLTKDINGKHILPKKNDMITISSYDESFTLTVNNYVASQIGGITIYASRGDW